MLELTHHQQGVDKVLLNGNQLLSNGKISPDEHEEIKVQLQLLNDRWQELRTRAVDRQNELVYFHELLRSVIGIKISRLYK